MALYRIIFVDDEQKILDGLRRLLRSQRKEWDMVFVSSGTEALARLQQECFDVIVTDMRMPEMDGFTLLTRVRETWPQMIRIILTGHTELESMLKIFPVAHQFLHKPCEVDDLKSAIERSFRLKSYLSNDELRRIIGGIDSLPVLPEVYHELSRMLADENTSFQSLGSTIEQDAGLSAKVLQVVNSALFGLPYRISNISHAIQMLGISTVRNLVMAVSLFSESEGGALQAAGYSPGRERQHALDVAKTAARLLRDKEFSDTAHTAGILHDLGKLVLALYYKEEYAALCRDAMEAGMPVHDLEKKRFGLTHAEAGAYLLGIWGLPYPVVEAVALHHKAELLDHEHFPVGTAVFLANQFVHAAEKSPGDISVSEVVLDVGLAFEDVGAGDLFRLNPNEPVEVYVS